MPIFRKKYIYLDPLEFFENENFATHALASAENLDLDFYNHDWPLVKCRLLSDQKKNHSTLLYIQEWLLQLSTLEEDMYMSTVQYCRSPAEEKLCQVRRFSSPLAPSFSWTYWPLVRRRNSCPLQCISFLIYSLFFSLFICQTNKLASFLLPPPPH